MTTLKRLWTELQASFWFVPSLIVAGSLLLAVALIEADSAGSETWLAQWPHMFGAGAAGARGMLSTIAGSMMSVVGVTFSMTLVTLTLASSQYTSRILRNFMRDRVTQVVLGIFAGIFTYCLIVLRTVRGGDDGKFVPSLAVTGGVVLAIGGIGVLIFFIHHIASSIQASSIVASVAGETMRAMSRLFPAELGQGPDSGEAASPSHSEFERTWQAIPARESGYIQNVDEAALLRVAERHQAVVRMECEIGGFMVRRNPLASVSMATPLTAEIVLAVQIAYGVSRYRTLEQDAAFGIRQIVDMALRALSPSTNDTTTAVMCVDYLTAILAELASRPIPATHRYEDGVLRVIAVRPTFAGFVEEAFDQILGSGAGNLAILLQMLVGLETIAQRTNDPGRRQVLRAQVNCIAEVARRTLASPHERLRFEQKIRPALAAIETIRPSTRNQPAQP